ncbi:MAG: response regulator [Deltaproteobacteria bacterium]|nr:response regulator [Deltaproteobacteria bacterium]
MPSLHPTVLVVDDDQDIRHFVMDVLRRAGYRVMEAGDGAEALAVATETRPDLVLLDMAMPGGMDGAAVAREMCARFAESPIPLVALSGGRDPSDRRRALDAGCSLYLTKPCAPARLRKVVATMLRPAVESEMGP